MSMRWNYVRADRASCVRVGVRVVALRCERIHGHVRSTARAPSTRL